MASAKRAKRRKREPDPEWQLWAVVIGVALVLLAFGFAILRNQDAAPADFAGTVVSKEIAARPGRLDRLHLRQLTIESAAGERTTVEVEKWLFDAVEEGFSVERSRAAGVVVRDADGRDVTRLRPEELPAP